MADRARKQRILRGTKPDFDVGCFVRQRGSRKVGMISELHEGSAWVDWISSDVGTRSYLMLAELSHAEPKRMWIERIRNG